MRDTGAWLPVAHNYANIGLLSHLDEESKQYDCSNGLLISSEGRC